MLTSYTALQVPPRTATGTYKHIQVWCEARRSGGGGEQCGGDYERCGRARIALHCG